MRHPGFGSDEAPALDAAGTIELRTHFADRQSLLSNFPADRLPTTSDELSGRGGKGLRHGPDARIRRSDLSLLCRHGRLGLSRFGRRRRSNRQRSRDRLRWTDGDFDRLRIRRGRGNDSPPRPAHTAGGDVDRPEQFTPVLGHADRLSHASARRETLLSTIVGRLWRGQTFGYGTKPAAISLSFRPHSPPRVDHALGATRWASGYDGRR